MLVSVSVVHYADCYAGFGLVVRCHLSSYLQCRCCSGSYHHAFPSLWSLQTQTSYLWKVFTYKLSTNQYTGLLFIESKSL